MCTHTECDKSFTRSDALAKHMRLQHNIDPPAPGRGGARKRKRGEEPSPPPIPPPTNGFSAPSGSAFKTFKVEQSWSNVEPMDDADIDYDRYVSALPTSPADDEDRYGSPFEILPGHLRSQYDPSTKLVNGRSPEMVMYILMKAKHRYALQQQDILLEELKQANAELVRVKEEKEVMMDQVLRATFGYVAVSFSKILLADRLFVVALKQRFS